MMMMQEQPLKNYSAEYGALVTLCSNTEAHLKGSTSRHVGRSIQEQRSCRHFVDLINDLRQLLDFVRPLVDRGRKQNVSTIMLENLSPLIFFEFLGICGVNPTVLAGVNEESAEAKAISSRAIEAMELSIEVLVSGHYCCATSTDLMQYKHGILCGLAHPICPAVPNGIFRLLVRVEPQHWCNDLTRATILSLAHPEFSVCKSAESVITSCVPEALGIWLSEQSRALYSQVAGSKDSRFRVLSVLLTLAARHEARINYSSALKAALVAGPMLPAPLLSEQLEFAVWAEMIAYACFESPEVTYFLCGTNVHESLLPLQSQLDPNDLVPQSVTEVLVALLNSPRDVSSLDHEEKIFGVLFGEKAWKHDPQALISGLCNLKTTPRCLSASAQNLQVLQNFCTNAFKEEPRLYQACAKAVVNVTELKWLSLILGCAEPALVFSKLLVKMVFKELGEQNRQKGALAFAHAVKLLKYDELKEDANLEPALFKIISALTNALDTLSDTAPGYAGSSSSASSVEHVAVKIRETTVPYATLLCTLTRLVDLFVDAPTDLRAHASRVILHYEKAKSDRGAMMIPNVATVKR